MSRRHATTHVHDFCGNGREMGRGASSASHPSPAPGGVTRDAAQRARATVWVEYTLVPRAFVAVTT